MTIIIKLSVQTEWRTSVGSVSIADKKRNIIQKRIYETISRNEALIPTDKNFTEQNMEIQPGLSIILENIFLPGRLKMTWKK
jgi:hypothetical protein